MLLSSEQSFFKDLNQTEVLPADESFIFNAYKLSEDRIILTWVMKENCFLYKDKFKISANNYEFSKVNTIGRPKKINDIYFGEVEVYFNSVSKELAIEDEENKIEVSYQGCNEKGFCYPVITKELYVKNLNKT